MNQTIANGEFYHLAKQYIQLSSTPTLVQKAP